MTMKPDVFDYIVLAIVLIAPIFDWRWYWPRCVRAIRARIPGARVRFYRTTMTAEWIVTLYVVGLWSAKGRPWSALRLASSSSLRLAIGYSLATIIIALFVLQAWKVRKVLARPEAVARLRQKLAFADALVPETDGERRGFWVVSVTAGICEELVFRGFLIWLITAWLGLVAAVIISSIIFGFGHIYLGVAQVPRTALIGMVLALIVVGTGSLWPAMVIHAAVDLNSGEIGFRVGRAAAAPTSAAAPPATS
jgi:uncharacterized protein